MEISISKEVLPTIEGYDLEETLLGDRKGSIRQYRNSSGLHVREYHDRFVIHKDRVDPRTDPIGHLVKDSPETLLSFGASLFLSQNRRDSDEKSGSHDSFSILGFVLSFLFLNKVLAAIRRLL